MAEGDFLDDRRRASEDDYFRKRDRELLEKLRQASEADRARQEISAKTGLNDPELLQDLQELGFTPETLGVLPLVPIVEMAWAEGGITPAERQLLVKLARDRGIAEGSAADRQLSDWMSHKPAAEVFSRATRLIRAMLDTGTAEGVMSADDVIKYAEKIATASGGIFGIIGKISPDERATLDKIAAELKARG